MSIPLFNFIGLDKEVFKNCVKALWSACVNESNAELASQENILTVNIRFFSDSNTLLRIFLMELADSITTHQ